MVLSRHRPETHVLYMKCSVDVIAGLIGATCTSQWPLGQGYLVVAAGSRGGGTQQRGSQETLLSTPSDNLRVDTVA
jgi:hypothetical protein